MMDIRKVIELRHMIGNAIPPVVRKLPDRKGKPCGSCLFCRIGQWSNCYNVLEKTLTYERKINKTRMETKIEDVSDGDL